jgi:hypothetical protein
MTRANAIHSGGLVAVVVVLVLVAACDKLFDLNVVQPGDDCVFAQPARPAVGAAQPTCWRKNASVRSRASWAAAASYESRSSQLKP